MLEACSNFFDAVPAKSWEIVERYSLRFSNSLPEFFKSTHRRCPRRDLGPTALARAGALIIKPSNDPRGENSPMSLSENYAE
jgi:hypothetical protein